MKQLIIILSIVLCSLDSYSQLDPQTEKIYTEWGYVDFYDIFHEHGILKQPTKLDEESFISALDSFFRKINVVPGYVFFQVMGLDVNRGTFFMVEFHTSLSPNQPINIWGDGICKSSVEFTRYLKYPIRKK
jgi:hypothetical protein